MAAGKIFAISFAIGAVMNASFGTAMNRSSLAMQQLSDNTRFLNAEQQRLERAWQASQGQVKAYAREIDRIRQQYDAGKSHRVSTRRRWNAHSRECARRV